MKKKWISGALCTALLAGGVTPVWADTSSDVKVENMKTAALQEAMKEADITRDEAVKIAKDFVKVAEDFEQEDVRFDSHFNGREQVKEWEINWSKQGKNFEHISVNVNADTGDVTRMNIHRESDQSERTFPPKVDFEKATSIAQSYIEERYSDQIGELKLNERSEERSTENFRRTYQYRVEFNQLVNGVSYPNNSIDVTVSGNGDVTDIYYRWDEVDKFEEVKNVLTKEKAFELFKEDFDVELRYGVNHYSARAGDDVKAYLTYVPTKKDGLENYGLSQIDAQTGEWINHEGTPLSEIDESDKDKYAVSEEPVAEEAEPLQELEEELSQEEAMKKVKAFVDLPDGYELAFSNYDENNYRSNENPTWRFEWRDTGERNYGPTGVHVAVDATTGEILNYDNRQYEYYEGVPEDFEVNTTKEEAKETAISFVKEVAPSKLDQIHVSTPHERKSGENEKVVSYNVNFERQVNGLPVQNQGVNVSVAADTGEVIGYNLQWDDVQFPDQDKAISKEEAKETLLDKYDLKLQYFTPFDEKEEKEENKDKDEAMLVYQPSLNAGFYTSPRFFDATKGVWIDEQTMEPVVENTKEVTDIEGHPAEQALRTLVEYNMIEVEDGKVNPDEVLTRADVIELMMKGLGFDDYYYSSRDEMPFEDVEKGTELYRYLTTAIERGYLDGDEEKFYPEKEAEREYVAKLLVKALGYDNLASKKGIFEADFSDESEMEYEGHVALATRLGLMSGKDGAFEPNESITKAEAAVSLLKYLEIEPTLNEDRY